jgi:hypothetical protein
MRNIPPSIRRGKIIWQANWPTRDGGRQLRFRSSRDSGTFIIRSRAEANGIGRDMFAITLHDNADMASR